MVARSVVLILLSAFYASGCTSFGSPNKELGIIYGVDEIIEGDIVNKSMTTDIPIIAFSNQNLFGKQKYMAVMIDPNAVIPSYLHWLRIDIDGTNPSRTGNDLIAYHAPAPPAKSGRHRYVTLLFNQPSAFALHPDDCCRMPFDIAHFIRAHGLGCPVSRHYFFVDAEAS